MKKKLLLAVMLLCGAMALAACGGKDTVDETANVVLGQYKGLEVNVLDRTVADEDAIIEAKLALVDYAEDVTDRTDVRIDDVANIDFVGKVDGVAFSGGSSTGEELLIGSNSYITGFEEGLIGANVGDTVDVNVTFPTTYTNTELAGKDAVFTVTINSLKMLPEEITDTFVATYTDYDTYEALVQSCRESLASTLQTYYERYKQSELFTMIAESSTFNIDLTQSTEDYVTYMKSMYEYYANALGYEYDVYIYLATGMTSAQFDVQLQVAGEYYTKEQYICEAIIDAEGWTVTDDEYLDLADELMRDEGYETLEALEAVQTKETTIYNYLYQKAIDLVMDTAIDVVV